MAKILYITDLDGTFLRSSGEVSEYSIKTIGDLIDKGLLFSAATARTSATAAKMLAKINMATPIILMNGAAIYDLKRGVYLSAEYFPDKAKAEFFRLLSECGSPGFLYTIVGGRLETWYVKLFNNHAEKFMEERIKNFSKVFLKAESFDMLRNEGAVHYSFCDSLEKVKPLYETACRIEGLNTELYRDIYNEDMWYFEVCAESASKYNAALRLKEMTGADKIAAFGDNLNDLPLFKAADIKIAVKNAKDELKARADIIIGDNDSDAVAEYLLKNYTP